MVLILLAVTRPITTAALKHPWLAGKLGGSPYFANIAHFEDTVGTDRRQARRQLPARGGQRHQLIDASGEEA